MELFLLTLPWLVVGLLSLLAIRLPRLLPEKEGETDTWNGERGDASEDGTVQAWGHEAPFLSVVIPARNEEANIGACLSSLAAQTYPAFEILVVDDESGDRTAEIVRETPPGNSTEIRLIRGSPLPGGWFGKPWACHQGAAEARGDLILFTDADTVHRAELLAGAVRALKEDGVDALTLMGRQVMDTFWEQLLQPQFFMLLVARFPRTGSPKRPGQWRHAIANGQYLLFRREAYEALGGHGAVAGEVAEDLRLAQLLVRGGWKLGVRGTKGLETRMYRSLEGLVEGWSKNVTTGALQTTPGWLLPMILPLSLMVGVTLWLLPPAVLAWALVSGQGGIPLLWGSLTTGFGVAFWSSASCLLKGNPLFGFLYPLGSVMGGFIFVKSWIRGRRIVWKGRTYEMPREARIGWSREGRIPGGGP